MHEAVGDVAAQVFIGRLLPGAIKFSSRMNSASPRQNAVMIDPTAMRESARAMLTVLLAP
ncbi:hypothetical protein AB5I41_08690 [Sphingomonas sp. MMS24-JH45]